MDFKLYSVKEFIEHALYGSRSGSLLLGYDKPREYMGRRFQQVDEDGNIVARCGVPGFIRFDTFQCYLNKFSYMKDKFNLTLNTENFQLIQKINKKGEHRISRKIYRLKGRDIYISRERNTYESNCETHLFMQRFLKNGCKEYRVFFKNTGCELHENYNSKGVCTMSLFHFTYEDGYGSIQMHRTKSNNVTFECFFGPRGQVMRPLIIPELKDASVVNLYREINCFKIDLTLTPEMHEVFLFGLEELKTRLTDCSTNAPHDKVLFRNMLQAIEEGTITYAQETEV